MRTNKAVYIIMVVLALTIIAIVIVTQNNFHSRVAMITEIDEENNLITVTCGNGNVFSFYDADNEDWICGDLCSLIMYDNFTDSVCDDVIVSARYGGFVRLFEDIEKTIKE